MNVRPDDRARCTALVQQALYDRNAAPGGGVSGQTWRRSAYPEAGLFWAVNKTIAGCAVPVRMGRGAARP